MFNTVTHSNRSGAFETQILDGNELIALGRGISAENSRRAARAVLDRMNLYILAALKKHPDTASGIAARLGMDTKTVTRLLFMLINEKLVTFRDYPVRGVVYKRSESAK